MGQTKVKLELLDATVPKIVSLTQAEYDALVTKNANTLYITTE
jgi:hypothetical protein